MIEHRYILKPYKGTATRHTCPECGYRLKFSRYVDTTTGNEVADHVGRCDRENNCGYHFTPKQFFAINPEVATKQRNNSVTANSGNNSEITVICEPVEFLPFPLMDKSVSQHDKCDLFPFLVKLFGHDIASQLCNNYFIGRNKDGNTAFWQVDISGNVRQCKIIQYLQDGHRNKSTAVRFAGKAILKNQDANLQQCFFGEFLLSFPFNESKPIAIVESEKTAVIASIYYPDFIWLATGGKHGAKWTERNVCKVLHGKKVILFPDLGAYEAWKAKGLLMAATAGCQVVISDLLERNASEDEKIKGLDLADYLLRVSDSTELALTDYEYPVIWDYSNKSLLCA